MRSTDVAVVGGGPAGAAAAITLARAGCRVVLVDKARFPRDKICGDGLTTDALRQLEALGLEPADVASWQVVQDVVVRSPGGREAALPFARGRGVYAVAAQRIDLDAAVLDLARAAGAEVLEGHEVTATEHLEDRVVLTVDGIGPVQARYVIAADGMWSPVRKHLGLAIPGYRGESHAFRQYFGHVSGRAARELFVWFDRDLLPGYAWSFPLPGGRANVGLGIHRGSQVRVPDMKRLWPELLTRAHIVEALGPDARPEGTHRAWPIPARVGHIALTAGRVLFVGDAAAATDPLTGEGIGQALFTGTAAARSILAAGPHDPTAATGRYETAVERDLAVDHRMANAILPVLRHERSAELAIRAAGYSPWTRRNVARWLFEDYPRALIVTPRRWHRGMFTGPGTYRHLPQPT